MTSRFTLGGPLCFTIKPTVRGTGKLTARTGPLAHSSQWLRAQPPLSHSCSPGATTLAGVVPHLRGRSLETPPHMVLYTRVTTRRIDRVRMTPP